MDSSRKKDISVALVIIASIILMIWGYNFLKGRDFFKNYKAYNIILDNSSGILEGTLVFINGVNVGSVTGINLNPDHTVTVTLNLPEDVKIYKNTQAEIHTPDILNGKAISLNYQKPSGALAANGDTLVSRSELGIMDKLSPKIDEIVPDLEASMKNISNITSAIDNTLNSNSKNDIQQSFSNLNQMTTHLNTVSAELINNLYYLNKTLANTAKFTGSLAANESKINNTLSNIENVSNNLSQSDFNQTVQKLDQSIENLNHILQSIDSSEGTLGLLLNDKGLYYRLSSTTESLNTLLDDIKANPKRYINVSVFGKNK